MFRTLGHRTDALAMVGRSSYEDRGSYVIQRTEAEPNFWFGNQLIYRTLDYDNADSLVCEFEGEFPDATHVMLSFDMAALDLTGFDTLDMVVEHVDVLARRGPVPSRTLPDGLTLRRIGTDADWAQVVALQHEIGVEQGYDPVSHLPFIEARFESIAARCTKDGFAWFGVFDGGLLVADMGITWDKQLARYQYVETRKPHRRQGICAALLSHVSAFAGFKARGAQQVIVADVDGAPGRIYRRAGFAPVEQLYSLYRPGY